MIKSLELHNFESHRHSLFEFVPGVNIIVGATDSGKTAVMRALRRVIKNRPLGEDFVSWPGVNDGGDSSVTITTNTDVVLRGKDKKGELYKVNDLEFRAFKTEVPKEVSDALNLSDVNLKTQFESHFLLSNTPGEVASHFNRIARLDKIDIATANVNKWISSINQTIANKNKLIEENQAKLKNFDHLTTFESEVKALEAAEIASAKLQTQYDQLDKLLIDIETVNNSIEREQYILQAEPLIDEILFLYKQSKTIEDDYLKLKKLVDEIITVENDLASYEQLLASETLIAELLKLYENKTAVETEHTKLFRLLLSITTTDKQLEQAEQTYNALHQQFEDEFPDVCPLCGKPK